MTYQRLTGVIAPLAVFVALAGVATSAVAQSFTLIGYPSTPPFSASRAYALSADGRSAAGYTIGIGLPGYRWNAVSGRNDFGMTSPAPSEGRGISGDGNVVVGGDEAVGNSAYRWTEATGYQSLGVLPNYSNSIARDANFDGSIVVGTLSNGPGSTPQAFRWTQAGGMQGLGAGTRAHAISGDGLTIVGESGTAPFGYTWTASGGLHFLPGLTGSNEGILARAINHDGLIVVGRSGPFTAKTTMWINGAPTELINTVPDSVLTACGVSDTGEVVAGQLQTATGIFPGIWTSATLTMRLDNFLINHGVVIPTGVTLSEVTAISADGRTFAGWTNGSMGVQGFVATIPAPSGVIVLVATTCSWALRRRRNQ